jgi:hypothetical protein
MNVTILPNTSQGRRTKGQPSSKLYGIMEKGEPGNHNGDDSEGEQNKKLRNK